MTLSTDTRTPTSSEGTPRRRGAARLEVYGLGLALAAVLAVVAFFGQSDYEPGHSSGGSAPTSAFARPSEALNGLSLAAYVAAHQSDRLGRQ